MLGKLIQFDNNSLGGIQDGTSIIGSDDSLLLFQHLVIISTNDGF